MAARIYVRKCTELLMDLPKDKFKTLSNNNNSLVLSLAVCF